MENEQEFKLFSGPEEIGEHVYFDVDCPRYDEGVESRLLTWMGPVRRKVGYGTACFEEIESVAITINGKLVTPEIQKRVREDPDFIKHQGVRVRIKYYVEPT